MTKKRTIALAAIILAAIPTAAFAGETVYGSGDSRTSAMNDAEARGRTLASEKRTCITTHAQPQTCRQDSGGWTCPVVVANEHGSCG